LSEALHSQDSISSLVSELSEERALFYFHFRRRGLERYTLFRKRDRSNLTRLCYR
jgi:hypothetical protein